MLVENVFGGEIPPRTTGPNLSLMYQEEATRDTEIDPALFTPKDQMRQWARLSNMGPEVTVDPAIMVGVAPADDDD